MRFGAAMVAKGYVPKDKVGAAEMGVKLARQMLPGGEEAGAAAGEALPAATPSRCPSTPAARSRRTTSCTPWCTRWPPASASASTRRRTPAAAATRAAAPSTASSRAGERVYTACPACDASLAESGVEAVPLWDALTERAGRTLDDHAARPPAERFVPYVGCLADRDAALAALGDAAEQSGAAMVVDYPTLHNGCCGALGGMYRGATKSSARLLEFAARAARAGRHDLRALPRQPPLGRARAQARRPRPLLARVLPGRAHTPPRSATDD